jgi:hypothetical protein
MVNMVRALAAVFIVASLVVLFAFEHPYRLCAVLVMVSSLLSLVVIWLERRAG